MRSAAVYLHAHALASQWNVLAAVAAFSLSFSFLLFATVGSARLAELLLLAGCLLVLLCYPEFALALFLVVGDVKGDDRIAALCPVDLTVTIGAIVVLGALLNLIRKKRLAAVPPMYGFFLALVVMMAVSLFYTPVFSAGLEKFSLFVTVTAIAILAPFFVLPDLAAMKRFLWAFGAAAYVICLASLAGLGGTDRLVTPSDNTIGLGRMGCVLAAMIWFAFVPGARLKKRLVAYVALSVPLIAMIGSGSRGSAIAFAALVAVTLLFYRRLLVDVALLAFMSLTALPFVSIPQASFRYLGSLFSAQTVGGLLDFRADLLAYGWHLVKQHPLIGAGIGGFRYSSPNPGLYKWPHDIFVELACELGIPAAIIAFAIFGSVIRESLHQLRDRSSPYFRLSMLVAGLLWIGVVAAVTTGNINSDRSIWLFVSLVFVVRSFRLRQRKRAGVEFDSTIAGSFAPARA
jgi:O-antigen ligase